MNCTITDSVLIVRFKSKPTMNQLLDPVSNAYEGPLLHREGHNFPASAIPSSHPLAPYKKTCSYVIATYRGDAVKHELLHAKYFLDPAYRSKIQEEWFCLESKTRSHIEQFLKRLGYSDKVLIDEYQAYRYSERPNFFGVRL